MENTSSDMILEKTGEIVASFVSNNAMSTADLPALIQSVHRALSGISSAEPEAEAPKAPAVSIRRSITPDYIVCLEEGRHFKSLKRHLRTDHDMDPVAYREKWGLSRDYPMVAPNYSEARSSLAKTMGLGVGGRKPAPAAAQVSKTAAAPADKDWEKAAPAPTPASATAASKVKAHPKPSVKRAPKSPARS